MLRGCWALALLTEVIRIGRIHPGSALARLDSTHASPDDLLDLATAADIDELDRLCILAQTALLPHLASRRGRWALGPTFAGSRLMKADADLIAAGLLLELKTSLGDRRSDGARRAGLETPALYQMFGYVLLDFDDEYAIDAIGLYSARYGHLATWPLGQILGELAGCDLDPAVARAELRAVLLRQTV